MVDEADPDDPAEGAEKVWQRNRRLRLAQIEADNERGRRLAEYYDRGQSRPRFVAVGHVHAKRRRWRR